MPSGGMCRPTRELGVVTGINGARRLSSTTNSNNNHSANSSVESKLKQETPGIVPKSEESPDSIKSKRFGLVYTRKGRKDSEEKSEQTVDFGIQFPGRRNQLAGLIVAIDGSCSVGLASFLLLVLGFMRKTSLRLSHLSSFLFDKHVRHAFAMGGIRFMKGSTDTRTRICKIYGVKCSAPIFSLTFSAVPSFFRYVHLRFLLKVNCMSFVPVNGCSTNVLVTNFDRDYRIQGVAITLELSDSLESVVTVKKDGLTLYTHLAQNNKQAISLTGDDIITWMGGDSWTLEFPDVLEWAKFKDLYQECLDRNAPRVPIPVPRFVKVVGYNNGIDYVPFARPEMYISVSGDEVDMGLSKTTAIYDMDSEDEEWLETQRVSENDFELLIDGFEMALLYGPKDVADVEAAVKFFAGLGGREVVECVYGYWTRKRERRGSALLRGFREDPELRARRSFMLQERGKPAGYMQATAAKHEEQKAVRVATLKRRRARVLMNDERRFGSV